MSKYMNVKIKILSSILFAFLAINKAAYCQIPDIDFPMNPNANVYKQYTDESDVYYKNGLDFLNSNQYTKAIDAFEKALSLTPDRVNTRINLAAS